MILIRIFFFYQKIFTILAKGLQIILIRHSVGCSSEIIYCVFCWLSRFCPEKYYPFDPAVRDKYVVGDDYLPMWKVSPFIPYHVLHGFSMKDSFDAWLRDQGKVRCLTRGEFAILE